MRDHDADVPAVLAIDGGSTKCDLALVAEDGAVLSVIRGPGLREEWSAETTVAELEKLIKELVKAAGRPENPVVARHISACLAHVDLRDEELAMTAAMRAKGWAHSVNARNDAWAVLRAGFVADQAPGAGVAVVCGTGINCVAQDAAGRTTRFIGLGSLSGDWGGGNDLGAAALWWAARSEDGRGPRTVLQATVPEYFGVRSMHEVQIAIRQSRTRQFGQLARLVLAAASEHDDVGVALVRRQAEEICTMALVAMRRLDLLDTELPVVLGGSVVATGHPQLLDGIADGLAAESRATVHLLTAAPIVGAALWGLNSVGATTDAKQRLRAALSELGRSPRGTAGWHRPG